MTAKFVAADFDVPISLTCDHFRLEVLEPSVVELDYEAVMSSRENLRQIFSENDDWPSDDMTLAKNKNDLTMHLQEFNSRKAFAYTVLTPDKTRCIGCLYIEPCNRNGYDSEVYFWIRDDCRHLQDVFYTEIKNWLKDSWHFKQIAWPGREVSWNEWGKRSHDHI